MNPIPPGLTTISDPFFQTNLTSPPFPLFDVHVNIGMTDSQGLSFGRLSPDNYLSLMEASHTITACAFPPLLEDYQTANQSLLKWSQTTNGRVLPFARLGGNLLRPLQERWQLRKSLRNTLTKQQSCRLNLEEYAGVKLIPHMSGIPKKETLHAISTSGIAQSPLPVLIHSGVHCPPSWIEQHLLPKLKGIVILAHLGAFPCSPADLKAAVDLAQRYERVYLDTSGVWLAAFMEYAVEQIPRKLLFGSDAPLMHPLTAWYHLASIVKNTEDLEWISYRTAQSIFKQ